MMRRTLLAAALIAALSVPVAFAVPPPGKGKPLPTGPGCKPKVTVILKGTLTSDPEFVGVGTFTMSTTRANKHGQNLVGGVDETIAVGADTKIRRQGAKLVAALESGDRAVVQLRVCKADVPLDAAELLATPASRVTAQAPKA